MRVGRLSRRASFLPLYERTLMGLRANIYKHKGRSFSNGGISSYADEVTIVNIDGPYEPTLSAPAVRLQRGAFPNTAEVVPELAPSPEHSIGPMAGGTYVAYPDSRFRDAIRKITGSYDTVVPLHDRFETPLEYSTFSA